MTSWEGKLRYPMYICMSNSLIGLHFYSAASHSLRMLLLLLKIAMCTNMNWGMAYENMQFAAKVVWKEFCTDFWD